MPKQKNLGELVEGYSLLTDVEEMLEKDPWDYKARANLSQYFHDKPNMFTETGPDVVKARLHEASADAKKPGLKKTRKDLVDYVDTNIDDMVKRLSDNELWALAFNVKPEGKKKHYDKINEFKHYAALQTIAEEKGSVEAMRNLLAGLYDKDLSVVYLSGGRDETVKRFYAESQKDIAKRIEDKKKEIKGSEIRDYIRHGLKELKDEQKSQVYPMVATMYHEKTKKKKK